MSRNRRACLFLMLISAAILAGCARTQTVCPVDEGAPRPALQLADLVQLSPPAAPAGPVQVTIQGKKMAVDGVVDYPLCNDRWSGTVYVSCKAQVAEAELDADANPLFLKGCSLEIAPNTVVYVAAHNDAPYYKGCSCHTGAAPGP